MMPNNAVAAVAGPEPHTAAAEAPAAEPIVVDGDAVIHVEIVAGAHAQSVMNDASSVTVATFMREIASAMSTFSI